MLNKGAGGNMLRYCQKEALGEQCSPVLEFQTPGREVLG